ncbi:TMV resistance protein N-like [Neltuma alba]|uniref:TMV resistance protein N-like n=1 Tax=Neltuma alba TaxID=207710 RepID=UPI0010A41190|nr:TMV resistance protein N-like [Prosopis alba]
MARDADGVGCSSSSFDSTKRWKYHVFLSFRGEDTRKNFTDHLYAALKRKGFRTFRDEEELERGESINPSLIQAIEESRSAIIVLSPNYASSTWCLDELQKILLLKEERSLQVFPIFYGVDPSDVRKQKGSFAEAFMKHEERFAEDKLKVQKWRDAFEKVATLSGWDSKNRYESEFIESIAEEMGSKLLDKSAYGHGKLIGIEPKLEKLKSIVARESGGVGFIGIWGTGGVGKTTLARAFYERERERKNFEIHCFLNNIREAWEKEGLISLPRKLISSLDKKSMEVADFYEGMELIKSKLTDRKILLVLDDVSDIRQLENLAPKQGWFSEGSIIIITTRDKQLLSSHGVSAVYEFKLLSDKESLELFLQKAFKEEHPNEDYLKLARTVIKYAGGLPLVLTVLGSSLCKRPVVEWKDELAKLKKIPPKDILKILQVSFDGLDDQQKTIFLDIACFFNGMDKDHVIQILETLDKDLHPKTGINVLIKKSLIITYEGHLWVHEILQDMCKYIVYQESPYDAGKRSRILSLEDANHSLPSLKSLDLSHSEYLIETPNFDRIPHLEKLILEGCSNLVEVHQSLGQHKRLVTVDLKDCEKVKTLPEKFEINGLETFILSGCSKVRKLPQFGKDMTRLSKLDLEKTAIAKLPHSLGNLIGLVELNLTNCKKLICLPCSVSKLKALKVIKISRCSKFSRLPENLNENEALEVLDLSGIAIKGLSFSNYNGEAQSSSSWSCFSLFQSPSRSTSFMLLPSLSSLTHLCLQNCNLHDASLPDDISMLSSLEKLNLSHNNFIDVPSGLISNLSKLKTIGLCSCPRLRSLPQLPSNLSCICADDSSSMKHYGRAHQLWDFIESFQPQVRNHLNMKSAIVKGDSEILISLCPPFRALTIEGSKVPSWFYNQNYFCEKEFWWCPNVSFIINISPDYCGSREWLGIAICLVIEKDRAFGEGMDAICWSCRLPNDEFPNSYHVSHVYLNKAGSPQLHIIYIPHSSLLINGSQMVFFSENAMKNKSPRMKISKCGWQAVCKEDVEAWRRTRDEGCSIINNHVKIDPAINSEGYGPWPRHDDTVVEVDGACSHLDDKAACGGVLKDGNNCMKEAFLLKLSGGDILTAKLWGCLMGLKRAWDAGIGYVILRSDSTETVRLIKFEVPETHKDIAVIMEIKGMLERKWFVDIQVFHRDGNVIAGLLAKRALKGAMGLQILGPKTMMKILQATGVTLAEDEKDGGYTQCSRHHDQFVVEEDESILPSESDSFNNPHNEVENREGFRCWEWMSNFWHSLEHLFQT